MTRPEPKVDGGMKASAWGCIALLVVAAAVGVAFLLARPTHAEGTQEDTPGVELSTGVACANGVGCTERLQWLNDLESAAAEADVAPADLLGALNSLADAGYDVGPREYLFAPAPVAACGWPICGALGQRLYCIESIESRHGEAMFNSVGLWYGNHVEHAQGWLGFMPTTAQAWGAGIGDRASEWAAAAQIITAGRGSAFYGISAGIC